MGATCRQSVLISESSSDWDSKTANSHKQISHIPHLTFKHTDKDRFQFWLVPKYGRVTHFRKAQGSTSTKMHAFFLCTEI